MELSAEEITLVVVVAVVVIGIVAAFASRIGVAAPLILVVLGIGLGLIPGAPHLELAPELILTVVLPPLLYAAARRVPFVDFRRNLRVIAFLSIVLVVVSAFAVGLLIHWIWATVPLALAVALGAVVAPPDAVAATSLGKRLGLPPRIVTILEGEGLMNDATALVLLSTALSFVAAGSAGLEAGYVIGTFAWAVIGAVIVGWAAGSAAVLLRQKIPHQVFDTALSIAVPFLVFVLAETVHASGVVAVVVAGIVVGNTGTFRIRAAFRVAEDGNWRTFTMIVENAVFLYMGYQLWPVVGEVLDRGQSHWAVLGMALLVTLVLVAIRFAVMPVLLWSIRRHARRAEARHEQAGERLKLVDERMSDGRMGDGRPSDPRRVEGAEARVAGRLERMRMWLERNENDITAERDQALGWRDGIVLGWSGMRGVVTVAAAQTLPEGDPLRAALILVAFAVAILTLLAQGLTLAPIVKALHLRRDSTDRERREFVELRRVVGQASDAALERAIEAEGERLHPEVATELRDWSSRRMQRVELWGDTDFDDPQHPVVQFQRLRRVELEAARTALMLESGRGRFSSEAIALAQAAMDSDEMQLDAYERSEDDE